MAFRDALTTAGPIVTLGYIVSMFVLACRVEWLRSKRQAPDGRAMFGWLGLNTIRYILSPDHLQVGDFWTTGLVWSARAFGVAFILVFAGTVWSYAQLGLY